MKGTKRHLKNILVVFFKRKISFWATEVFLGRDWCDLANLNIFYSFFKKIFNSERGLEAHENYINGVSKNFVLIVYVPFWARNSAAS